MLTRAFELGAVQAGDGRTVTGLAVPYDTPTTIGGVFTERFAVGAFEGTDPAGVRVLVGHDAAGLPVAKVASMTHEARGLVVDFRMASTRAADEVLALAADGIPVGLSVGFRPLVDRWNRTMTDVTRGISGSIVVMARSVGVLVVDDSATRRVVVRRDPRAGAASRPAALARRRLPRRSARA